MKELELKYGMNPNQKPARIYIPDEKLPIKVLNGNPGYINFLDALNSWQLVRELKEALKMPAAASFKHVSPAGAAVGQPLCETLKKIYFVEDIEGLDDSPLACAYARARGTDRVSSYGDWVALSDECDEVTAKILAREVSDGVIAPSYSQAALDILKTKRKGSYNIIEIDADYIPSPLEKKQVFGITFEQGRNDLKISQDMLDDVVTDNNNIPESARRDLLLSLISLKYTQSNSVCYAYDGQTIGVGAGQQARILCTRLAGNKADLWILRQHPRVLDLQFVEGISRPVRDNTIDTYLSDEFEAVTGDGLWQEFFEVRPNPLSSKEKADFIKTMSGISLGSDAFFPFGDNIERAVRSGVSFIAQPGGSIRDDNVIASCNKHNIAMAFTKNRLFHH